MARLNEPPAVPALVVVPSQPPTAETLDAQKRRFLRQNRELAKHNSCQSLRIRNLELDVSRLLAENLELRNQVLHLQNEVYTAQSQASTAVVQRIKNDLQAKIAELSGLVNGIEEIQQEVRNSPRKPLEGNWRERQPLTEIMRDSQMPTISEDKHYPRRTLNADEIRAIRLSDQSSNESPDLGPPPIARFDCDPVKNVSPLVNKVMPEVIPMEEDSGQLSVFLETRRKRKDGQPKAETQRALPQSPIESEPSSILRTGAKRKLADRETEKPFKPPSKADFTFSRKASGEAKTDAVPAQSKAADVAAPSSPKPVRKVLGDKSVNQSPRKTAPVSDKPEKKENAKPDNTTARRRRVSSIPVPSPERESVIETVEIAPPVTLLPKTPAPLDLFSPTPSEPSTLQEPGRGDTPPPGELSTMSIVSDGGVRPSRRARSAVNYAEPSLISKMRRPDRKMVDAVTGLQDPRRAMSVSSGKSAPVAVKAEPVSNEVERWKTAIPPAPESSPLTQKSGADDSDAPAAEEALSENPSQSSATISALVAASRKRRESTHHPLPPLGTDFDSSAMVKKMEELDLYEFKDSSPPTENGTVLPAATGKVKGHRRHSSVPKTVGSVDAVSGGDAAVKSLESETAVLAKVQRVNRAASRRRSMML